MRLFFALLALALLVFGHFFPFHIGPWWSLATPQEKPLLPASGQQRYIYTGTGSCAASNCHGSVTPRNAPKIDIQQDEHTHWLKKDKHARAYEVLLKERSVIMAQNLALPEKPDKSPQCLTCHALAIPTELQGPFYQVEDGVTCEACHGPAEGWLGTHITRGYAASLQVGMYDTKNLVKRAELCLSCHLGTAGKEVNHEMIAAGHPDLTFELDTFTALLPPHWRKPKGDWLSARAWAIGQAVTLREVMQRLARRTQSAATPGWPEFAEFDCFACHHEVRNIASTYYQRADRELLKAGPAWSPSWRQTRGYTGMAGLPFWETSRYVVFRQLVGLVAPEAQASLEQELAAIGTLMQKVSTSDPKQIATAATRVAQLVDQLIPQITKAQLNEQRVATLLQQISGNGEAISRAGVRAAEQAVMAIEALYTDYRKKVRTADEKTVKEALHNLFEALEKSHQYDQQEFARRMQAVQGLFTKP
jgi:hypothetical protein